MQRWVLGMLTILLVAPLVSGCGRASEECERERMALSKDWSTVRQSAMKRKLGGVDVAGWASVEKKADLLQSAFETKQVTWNSANEAQRYLVTTVSSLKAEDDLHRKTFQNTFDRALKHQEQYASECR